MKYILYDNTSKEVLDEIQLESSPSIEEWMYINDVHYKVMRVTHFIDEVRLGVLIKDSGLFQKPL